VNFSAKYLIKILEQNGYVFKRAKGSHHLYYSPASGKTITVPMHGNSDLPKGTFYTILKQAGIDKTQI